MFLVPDMRARDSPEEHTHKNIEKMTAQTEISHFLFFIVYHSAGNLIRQVDDSDIIPTFAAS